MCHTCLPQFSSNLRSLSVLYSNNLTGIYIQLVYVKYFVNIFLN